MRERERESYRGLHDLCGLIELRGSQKKVMRVKIVAYTIQPLCTALIVCRLFLTRPTLDGCNNSVASGHETLAVLAGRSGNTHLSACTKRLRSNDIFHLPASVILYAKEEHLRAYLHRCRLTMLGRLSSHPTLLTP